MLKLKILLRVVKVRSCFYSVFSKHERQLSMCVYFGDLELCVIATQMTSSDSVKLSVYVVSGASEDQRFHNRENFLDKEHDCGGGGGGQY